MNLDLKQNNLNPSVFGLLVAIFALMGSVTNTGFGNDGTERAAKQTASTEEEGFRSLFDGQTFNGWRPSEPSCWSVDNGTIVGLGRYSHLYFIGDDENDDTALKNFHFKAEVRTVGMCDSGICYFAKYEPTNAPEGMTFQIKNHGTFACTASLYDTFAKSWLVNVDEPPARQEQWFSIDIIVKDSRVVHKVDGKTIVDFRIPVKVLLANPRRQGGIALQLESRNTESRVEFRNIRLKNLDQFQPAESDEWPSSPMGANPDSDKERERFSNSLGIKFTRIPAGEFLMGSTESISDLSKMGLSVFQKLNIDSEKPQHRVRISQDFYMGIHEVTLGQFLEYYNSDSSNHTTDAEKDGKGGMGYDGRKSHRSPEYVAWNTGWNDPPHKFLLHPVVNVSWNDATHFCEWLTKKERSAGLIRLDQEYQLPTEAQWEYACRGGSKKSTLFSFGNDPMMFVLYGNIKDAEYATKLKDEYGDPIQSSDGYIFTSPVGMYEPNQFGLFDMHSNAGEWCKDHFSNSAYAERGENAIDPLVTNAENDLRVHRGGRWDLSPVRCRSAYRGKSAPDSCNDSLGFRLTLQTVK